MKAKGNSLLPVVFREGAASSTVVFGLAGFSCTLEGKGGYIDVFRQVLIKLQGYDAMSRYLVSWCVLLAAILGFGSSVQSTSIPIGSQSFSEKAFADTLIDANGSFGIVVDPPAPGFTFTPGFPLPGDPGDFSAVESAITGGDLNFSVEIFEGSLVVGFTDWIPFNGGRCE